jgi:hypothetical protein
MKQRDVSRSWSRNRRHLVRDRFGRLAGSTRIVLTAIQVRAVERAWRRGDSVESIADMVRVSKNTLYAIVTRQLGHLRMRGRGNFLRKTPCTPTEREIVEMTSRIRESPPGIAAGE